MSSYSGVGVLFLMLVLTAFQSYARQTVDKDSLPRVEDLSEVVVTATRSNRKLADVPIPVMIIGQEQIQSSGASRLNEILSEQTGLAIINDHGFGVQMQGMMPEYCLILINGEPVIGRTAGTLDLTRINLNNVQRIEIIKGPASSLYGSDALAGVINIITKNNSNTGIVFKSLFGANLTLDNTLTANLALHEKGSVSLSFNRYHTAGYDLQPETYEQTVDPYTAYTVHGKLQYQFSPKMRAVLNTGYYSESQQNNYFVVSGKDSILIKGKGTVRDIHFNPVITYRFSPKWKVKLRNYWSQYNTESNLRDIKSDTSYEKSDFRQRIWKEELQSEYILNPYQILTTGIGFSRQQVVASRYPSKEIMTNSFLYAQHEWRPAAKWTILTGLRYDLPSDYDVKLSPKIAAKYSPDGHWSFRASLGTGYKAPDFRQLFLTFSNPIVGYSVLGTEAVEYGLEKLKKEGQIKQVYVQPEEMTGGLKPESSMAYNLGGSYTGTSGWKAHFNFFRNDIKDLIDTRVIAMKTNGQPLYSYYNVNRVFTEGAEIEGGLSLIDNRLHVGAGYQFLIAKDKQVVEDIRDGKRFIRNPETLETRKLRLSDYGGLFNRSRHSFNIKIFYNYKSWSFNSRMIYRGRFGFADKNGDNILDTNTEYAPGYALCHLDVGKTIHKDRIKLHAGVKNLFNYTDPQHLSYEPGRTWFISATLQFFKTKTQQQ